ncbi:hypothetical protein DL93DRAFT_2089174 [Clavulina sp. PMI_390]|nr:hypothetical protein DL93DRAFT_2089174 [Clavulina sp. PMI_390]
MAQEAFSVANQAIDSVDRLISSMNFDATPLILHHPPSRRPSSRCVLQLSTPKACQISDALESCATIILMLTSPV